MKHRELFRYFKSKFKNIDLPIDSKGNKIITISLDSKSSIYSPYSYGKEKMLNSELLEMNNKLISTIKVSDGLHYNFNIPDIEDSEKEDFIKALHYTYTIAFQSVSVERKRNLRNSLIFTLMAVIFLTIMVILRLNSINEIIVELVDIAGWVFMWEAVDQFFIERAILNIKKKKYMNILIAPIDFNKDISELTKIEETPTQG